MYFPYLNNKQAESRAIKNLTINGKMSNVIPIISTSFIDKDVKWSNKSARVACALNRLKDDSDRFENTIGMSSLLDIETTNLVKLKEHTISHHIEFMSKY